MSKIGQAVLEEQERQEPYEEYVRRRLGMYDEPYSKWHMRFMDMAKMVSTWSKDPSSQIGAVAVNDERRILATGYNGFPKGIADTPERLNNKEEKYPRIVHAEMNALMNALYAGVSLKDATLYVHGLPVCPDCAKCIIQSGIKRVVIPTDKTNKGNWQATWEEKSLPMFEESGVQVVVLGL